MSSTCDALVVGAGLAGSVAAPAFDLMGIQRLPYFLVVDSTGTQLYRGPSITQAEKTLKSKL